MNVTIHKLCAWSGVACLVIMGIGFFALAGFIPPPHPNDSAQETARMFIEDKDAIRFGMILSMVAAALLMPFAVSMFHHMKRCEGRRPALAYIQLGLGAIFVLEFIYLIFFWQVATFRTDRAPELIQQLNDMAWVPFVGLSSTLVLQTFAWGLAMLLDKRPQPIFPRWLGYYNIWAALMFTPGSFNVFFHTGPLAWNGFLAFYLPVAVFVSWLIINSIYLAKAVDREAAEEALAPADGDTAAMAAEIARLREDLDRFTARAT